MNARAKRRAWSRCRGAGRRHPGEACDPRPARHAVGPADFPGRHGGGRRAARPVPQPVRGRAPHRTVAHAAQGADRGRRGPSRRRGGARSGAPPRRGRADRFRGAAASRFGRGRGGSAARRRLRGRASHRRRQAGRARRPSRARPCRRHPRQRVDRALRRQPLGDRRGQARRDCPSARQGHLRPHGRRQDRRRPSRPRRNSSPITAAAARSSANIWRSSGVLSAPRPARWTPRSPAIRSTARRWRSRKRIGAGAPSPIGGFWRGSARPVSSPAGSRPGEPTRSVCIWPRSDIRFWVIRSMARASKPRPSNSPGEQKPLWQRWGDRRCTPRRSGSSIRSPASALRFESAPPADFSRLLNALRAQRLGEAAPPSTRCCDPMPPSLRSVSASRPFFGHAFSTKIAIRP